MNQLQACRVLAALVLGAVWAWWMLLGQDLHWMMRNEAAARILPPQIPQKEPKLWCFPPKTSKFGSIRANIHAPFNRPLIPRSRRVQTHQQPHAPNRMASERSQCPTSPPDARHPCRCQFAEPLYYPPVHIFTVQDENWLFLDPPPGPKHPLNPAELPAPDTQAQGHLGTRNACFVAWPLELGLGTLNPCFVAWALELGSGTLNPRFVVWPLSWGSW